MIRGRRLSSLSALALVACSAATPPAESRAFREDVGAAIMMPPDPADSPVERPYAPTRSADLDSYSWQKKARSACATPVSATAAEAPVQAAPVRLTFSGSVASFPLLPEDEPNALPAGGTGPAPDTEGSGPPPAAEPAAARSPDVVVAALRPRLRRCFADLLERRAEAQGSVRFALELGCAGDVQSISAQAEGVDAPTVECLFAVVAPTRFDPPRGGRATIQVPVVFKNTER